MSARERAKQGIKSLPDDLQEAILETEKSTLVKETLGEHVFQQFIAAKKPNRSVTAARSPATNWKNTCPIFNLLFKSSFIRFVK